MDDFYLTFLSSCIKSGLLAKYFQASIFSFSKILAAIYYWNGDRSTPRTATRNKLSALAFIFANMGLNYFSKWFLHLKYFTNLAVFWGILCFYYPEKVSGCINKELAYLIEGYATIFYLLTTVFFYPILSALIEKSINILGQNDR